MRGAIIGALVGFALPFAVGTLVLSIGALTLVDPTEWTEGGRVAAAVVGLVAGAVGAIVGAAAEAGR